MDFRNSKLIVALAMAFCVIISMIAYLGLRNAGHDLLARSGLTEATVEPYPQYSRRYAEAKHRDETRDAIRSLKKLRELVHAKDRLLQQRIQQLQEVSRQRDLLKQDLWQLQREHDQLRRETDQTMNAFVEFSSQVNDGNLTSTVARENTATEAPTTEATNFDVEIELIEWQIEQANQRVADLELTALREIIRSNEATQALIATGAAAVPALLDRLAEEDPEIRRWAADVLGQIGPEASLAVEALLEALNDANEDVRESAKIALDRIENRS